VTTAFRVLATVFGGAGADVGVGEGAGEGVGEGVGEEQPPKTSTAINKSAIGTKYVFFIIASSFTRLWVTVPIYTT